MHVPYFILLDTLCLDLDLVLHAIGVHLEVFLGKHTHRHTLSYTNQAIIQFMIARISPISS